MLVENKSKQGQEQGQEQTFTRTVNAPPSEVYRAFTHPVALRDWLCNVAEIEPRAGGRVYLAWDSGYSTAGKYTELERNERIGFTWRGPDDAEPTQVLVTLAPEGEGTTVTLSHGGGGPSEEWVKLASGRRSWDIALENLQSVLERGVDLRFVRRPMFGLSGADILDEEKAAKLGLPVSEGLLLTGLVEGMAAQVGGLQPGDVLVNIGDYEVRDYSSLLNALSMYQAGDPVPATFYREGERQTLTLELSRRPLPEMPASTQALAESVRKVNAEVSKELDRVVAVITEEEAEYRPDEDAWSAKEVLAHLIAAEYDGHALIANYVEDARVDPAYYANGSVRLRAIAATHGTLPALAEELKRSQAITARMLAEIPPQAAERKRILFGLALSFDDTNIPQHTRDHIREMEALAEAARGR